MLKYGSDVLAAGGDPNVYFAQNPLPSTLLNSFNNPLNPGFGFDALNPIGTTLNAINLSFSRLSIYPSPFLVNVNQALYVPQSPITTVNYYSTLPGCTVPNPYLPTILTFNNLSSGFIRVSRMNYLCQEMFYAILLPRTTYSQLTFVGDTWRFRNAATFQPLLGQPQFTITSQSPWPTYTIFDTLTLNGQQQLMTKANASDVPFPRETTQNLLEGPQSRYGGLSDMQLGNYYSDPAVGKLQEEMSQQTMLRLQTDPLYLYWQKELTAARSRIEQAQPSYARYRELSSQIDSWTSSADEATQRSRYASRQEFQRIKAQLEQQKKAFLARNPALSERLVELEAWLANRLNLLQNDPEFVRWQADWAKRWERTYLLSNSGVETLESAKRLTTDFPEFSEYQKLRREVVDLLPGLDQSPPVRRFTAVKNSVTSDLSADEQVRATYDAYTKQVEATMSGTTVPVLLENYYNALNGMIKGNATYQQLQAESERVLGALDKRQIAIHDAVAACFQRDPKCNPYNDKAVKALLYAQQTTTLVNQASAFYQQQSAFWYEFYHSTAYTTMENDTKAALQGPLSSIQPQLAAAKAQYDTDLAAIPQMKRLREASNTMISELCAPATRATRGPVNDPTTQICANMARLNQIDQQFAARTRPFQPTQWLFVPQVSQ